MTFEIAQRLVLEGHYVEWFSAAFPGAPATETIEGIQFMRSGRQWSVHWRAFRHYRGRLRGRFDVVIDEVNTIPFLTPLWSDVPTVMFIHQLAKEVWWYESAFPLNAVGYFLEPLYLRPYRRANVITVSESTRQDLRRLNFRGELHVIPEGLEPIQDLALPKAAEATFLYVGRLAPSKRVEHIIQAFAQFWQQSGVGRLELVGTGHSRYEATLKRLVTELKVDDRVQFFGRVSAGEKHRLMAQACAVLMTSVREGWGLVVTEANACGTPAIVYDVPGLRDSVQNDATGLVVSPKPSCLTEAMTRLTRDAALYARLVAAGKQWSNSLSFDDSAVAFTRALQTAVDER